jgi:hypothetical protein
MSRSSKPTSRSPTAVACAATRLTAPPITHPLSMESGEVTDPTSDAMVSITGSERSDSRCDRQW